MIVKKVVGIERDEVFWYLKIGREVYAIDSSNDELINLRYKVVDTVLGILEEDSYAYFVINCEERG